MFHCESRIAISAWRITWNYDDYILFKSFKWTLPLSLFTHKSWLKIDDRSRNYLIFLGKWLLLIQEIKNTICSISRIKISLTILWKLTTAENDLARILKTVRADLGGAEARCSKLGSLSAKTFSFKVGKKRKCQTISKILRFRNWNDISVAFKDLIFLKIFPIV